MLTRPNPWVAKTPKAASRSRPRVSGRRRVTRAGVPSARSFARRARWLGDRFGVSSGVMILLFRYINVSDTLTYRNGRVSGQQRRPTTKRTGDEPDTRTTPAPAGASHTTTLPRRIPGRIRPAHVLAGDRGTAHPGRLRALLCRRLSPPKPAPGADRRGRPRGYLGPPRQRTQRDRWPAAIRHRRRRRR